MQKPRSFHRDFIAETLKQAMASPLPRSDFNHAAEQIMATLEENGATFPARDANDEARSFLAACMGR